MKPDFRQFNNDQYCMYLQDLQQGSTEFRQYHYDIVHIASLKPTCNMYSTCISTANKIEKMYKQLICIRFAIS